MDRRQNRRWNVVGKSNLDPSVVMKYFEIHNLPEDKSPRTVE
jgi:hypothetical protein